MNTKKTAHNGRPNVEELLNLIVQIIHELLGRTIVLCVNQSLVAVAYRQFATVDGDGATETFLEGNSVSAERVAVGNGIRVERVGAARMPDFILRDGRLGEHKHPVVFKRVPRTDKFGFQYRWRVVIV